MWAQVVSALLGVWLMAAPAILIYDGAARTSDRIVGPLVAAIGFVAIWEVTRPLRWLNLVLGAWLLLAPWLVGYDLTPKLNSLVVGAILLSLARMGGKLKQRYSGGWQSLVSRQKLDAQ
jgi:hypothetical protein